MTVLKKVTITTVANKAEVSVKTVSRVLNRETPMRDSTRDKVLKAINELGYKPSLAAVALAGRQSKMIGLVYSNISASYVMSIQTGVLKACSEEGCNLIIHPCDSESKSIITDIVNFAKNSHLDGVILIPPLCNKKGLVEALTEHEINVVNISPAIKSEKVPSVCCEDKAAVEVMIGELIEAGHSEIGFIKGDFSHGASLERLMGYKSALLKAGLQINESLIKQGNFTFESGKACGQDLLSMANRPTAIFASNDYMAAGVFASAYDIGLKIPNDLSVVGFDDAPVSRQICPLLSTIKQPIEKMAESAARLLIAKNKGRGNVSRHLSFSAELLYRESHKQHH